MEQQGIILKNINLDNITLVDQIKKVKEEDEEFKQACENMDIENMIEEFFDGMQARLGVLQKLGINAEQIMEQYQKHLEKIKNRPRNKECDKCIHCNNRKREFAGLIWLYCNEDKALVNKDRAKECEYYKEQE